MAPTTKECIAYWRAATTCHKLPGQNPHKKKDGSHPMSRSTVVHDLEAFRREVWREEETKGDQGVARPKVGDEVYIELNLEREGMSARTRDGKKLEKAFVFPVRRYLAKIVSLAEESVGLLMPYCVQFLVDGPRFQCDFTPKEVFSANQDYAWCYKQK